MNSSLISPVHDKLDFKQCGEHKHEAICWSNKFDNLPKGYNCGCPSVGFVSIPDSDVDQDVQVKTQGEHQLKHLVKAECRITICKVWDLYNHHSSMMSAVHAAGVGVWCEETAIFIEWY
ncbi:hypothetical protein PR048_018091 [Dryococelus australis]|uniref:Uncharacterized protein n=1 Tax=Dryococelus australis TaxID=614101 RepID=A0ABQ9HBH4_9NEOP|nr:hypothetical protein PR048_018091 [Dryococelus australis]